MANYDADGACPPPLFSQVIELSNLTELNMSGNSLSNVVADIDKLKHLKTIDISYNRVKLLPPTIGKLKRLETLDVQHNLLKHLPAVLSKIKALTALHIAGNKNLMVPPEIINAGAPTIKFFLEGIYTGSNDSVIDWSKLNTLGIVKLRFACLALREPTCRRCSLTAGPACRRVPDVLFQMNWVSDLNLDNNNIAQLPPEIKSLKSLTKLSLRGNFLETLPQELKRCMMMRSTPQTDRASLLCVKFPVHSSTLRMAPPRHLVVKRVAGRSLVYA